MKITLTVGRKAVYDEAGKIAAYVGAKMDAETYDRMMLTEENEEVLNSFWNDAKVAVANSLKEWLAEQRDTDTEYAVVLDLPENFKAELKDSMESGLTSYFVQTLAARWFMMTNKEEAEPYATAASGFLEQVNRATYERNRPARPE